MPLGAALRKVEEAMAALARIEAIAVELKDAYLISRILTRREAVASSAIEGTHSTLDELLAVEETQDEPGKAATRQVRDYALALDELVPDVQRLGATAFSLDLIGRMHQRVMRDDPEYGDPPGRLRQRVVWIGGARDIAYSSFNPPPPDEVASCLTALLGYMRGEGMQAMTQGLLTRITLAHAQFEAIHPFRDGNGRVGRLLIPLMMVADGRIPLYLAPFIETRRAEYYAALKGAQQRLDWEPLVGFFAEAVIATVTEVLATRAALAGLQAVWRCRRDFRRDSASARALDWLPHYPVVTVRRLSDLLAVSFKSAAQAVEQLAEVGILTERTGHARNRVFAAGEALSILNRPFGAEPVLPET